MSVPNRPYHGDDALGRRIKEVATTWTTATLEAEARGRRYERTFRNRGQFPVSEALHEVYREAFGTEWGIRTIITARLQLWDAESRSLGMHDMRVAPAENNSFDLFFADNSTLSAYAFRPGPPLDDESRLIEPITADEYGIVESLIGLLDAIITSSPLDEDQELRVRAALEVLSTTHRESVVGETKRLELWAVTKRVMVYLYKELPVDVVKWAGAAAVVSKAWPMLGEFLRSL